MFQYTPTDLILLREPHTPKRLALIRFMETVAARVNYEFVTPTTATVVMSIIDSFDSPCFGSIHASLDVCNKQLVWLVYQLLKHLEMQPFINHKKLLLASCFQCFLNNSSDFMARADLHISRVLAIPKAKLQDMDMPPTCLVQAHENITVYKGFLGKPDINGNVAIPAADSKGMYFCTTSLPSALCSVRRLQQMLSQSASNCNDCCYVASVCSLLVQRGTPMLVLFKTGRPDVDAILAGKDVNVAVFSPAGAVPYHTEQLPSQAGSHPVYVVHGGFC